MKPPAIHRGVGKADASLRLQQTDHARIQGLSQSVQDQQRRVFQATLDLADVGPIDFGLKCKLFLCEVLRSTKAQQIRCQRPLHLLELPIHAERFAAM